MQKEYSSFPRARKLVDISWKFQTISGRASTTVHDSKITPTQEGTLAQTCLLTLSLGPFFNRSPQKLDQKPAY